MSVAKEIGRLGEDMTARYLEGQGFYIARRNYTTRYGEIDIVAENREYIVFVEVKTRDEGYIVSPQAAVTKEKQRKIVLTALDYLRLRRVEMNYRFDIAEVTYKIDENGEFKASLNYIKNAFNEEVLDNSFAF